MRKIARSIHEEARDVARRINESDQYLRSRLASAAEADQDARLPPNHRNPIGSTRSTALLRIESFNTIGQLRPLILPFQSSRSFMVIIAS
jgi:hypothetical protein